jgi:hypothetical protein
MRQMNDPERNPEGNWSLVYSTSNEADAKDVMLDFVTTWSDLGDRFKIVDNKVNSVITCEVY